MESKNNKNDNHPPVFRKAYFRFYEELNEHLPVCVRRKSFVHHFKGRPSVKNTIQAIGVPHGEIDLILVNGKPVTFNYQLQGEEKISVYPVFESIDISPLSHLRPESLRENKFIVDVNLGKLALKLRLLGFDVLFRNNFTDDEIVDISLKEKRIILTRDKELLKQNAVTHGYWLRNDDPKKQLKEVIRRLQLQNSFRPFSRCTNCNSKLVRADKNQLHGRIPEDTLNYYDRFWECSGCGKIYWEGSHFKHILKWIEKLKNGN